MVVAFVALLAALGGSAVAAKKVIHGSLIAPNSLPGDRILADSVTGRQINEATLHIVPDAAHANAADTAANATNATNAANATDAANAKNADHATAADTAKTASSTSGVLIFPRTVVDAAADLASATAVDLGTRDNLHFYGKCYLLTSTLHADIYVEVTTGTALINTEDQSDGVITSATAEAGRKVEGATAGANAASTNSNDADFHAITPNAALTGVIGVAFAKQGTVSGADDVLGAGNRCGFGGAVFG